MGTRLLRTYNARSLRRSALLRGAASSFDLSGNTMRQYRVGRDAGLVDYDAVVGDWQAVGEDLREAFEHYAELHG